MGPKCRAYDACDAIPWVAISELIAGSGECYGNGTGNGNGGGRGAKIKEIPAKQFLQACKHL